MEIQLLPVDEDFFLCRTSLQNLLQHNTQNLEEERDLENLETANDLEDEFRGRVGSG